MEPFIYHKRDVYKSKLQHVWNPKKWAKSTKQVIGKNFIYQNILPNKAQGACYDIMIDEIAWAGVRVQGSIPYEIGGPILDAEIEEIKKIYREI